MFKTKDNQVRFKLDDVVDTLMARAREKWPELPDPDSGAEVSLKLRHDDDSGEDFVVLDIN